MYFVNISATDSILDQYRKKDYESVVNGVILIPMASKPVLIKVKEYNFSTKHIMYLTIL